MKVQAEESGRSLLAAVAARSGEIAHTVLHRVHAIDADGRPADGEYLDGLRSAVVAAIDHTIDSSLRNGGSCRPVPEPVLAQARLAARRAVPLETVLRRYLAGHALLADVVAEEAERRQALPSVLRPILRSQAAETDRVLAIISATYQEQIELLRASSGAGRRPDSVRRLLNGEMVDPSVLGYHLDRWHVGLIVQGPNGEDAVAAMAARLDVTPLVVDGGDDGRLWAWIGSRRKPDMEILLRTLPKMAAATKVGIGEAAKSLSGWRLTHEQARAALSVATRDGAPVARYGDVALLASALHDQLLTTSLSALYLEPLGDSTGDGKVLRDTLRAYFDANGNVSSTASILGVSRNTVTNRLKLVETRIGHLKQKQRGDLALALRLERVMEQTAQPRAQPFGTLTGT